MEKLDDYTVTGSVFGAWVNVDKPKDSDLVMVCSNEGFGLKPERLLLWHQIYIKSWRNTPGLTLIPIRSKEYITLSAVGSDTSSVKNRTLAEREG